MSAVYDVEVYTTCALDYVTWKNHYRPGEENIHGILVRRFPVERTRAPRRFGRFSERILADSDHSGADEEKWIDEQGPVCPALLAALEKACAR